MDAAANKRLEILPSSFAVCRLDVGEPIPQWVKPSELTTIAFTSDEISIVCPEPIPEPIRHAPGWRALKVQGPLDFSLTGILAGLATALASAEIPIFAVSTFETDYILVSAQDLDRAVKTLKHSGYSVDGPL